MTTENRDRYAYFREHGVTIWPDEIKAIAAKIHAGIPDSNLAEWDEANETNVSPYTLEQVEAATFGLILRLVDDLKDDAPELCHRNLHSRLFQQVLRETSQNQAK